MPDPIAVLPPPADGDIHRNMAFDIASELLISSSGRWYPIKKGIPEILPDKLRNWDSDLSFLRTLPIDSTQLELFESFAAAADMSEVDGDSFKHAEINLLNLVEDRASFCGPGLVSPFNPGAFFHASDLIRGFSCAIPFMRLNQGSIVHDSGSGYCWTTEWFMKMGIRAVGVEINREYVDVGLQRMGAVHPEIVIADAENLPFLPGVFDAVLGFDAFHHIPNREHAMGQFARILKPGARITLVEPGKAHEDHPTSRAVMEKYDNLERGMSLDDVRSYLAHLPFAQPEDHFIQHLSDQSPHWTTSPSRDFIGWSLFTIDRE